MAPNLETSFISSNLKISFVTSAIPILKKDDNQKKSIKLKELIPNSTERFYENSKGKIIKLENFVN